MPKPSLFLTLPWQWAGWGCTRSWEGIQQGQLTPTDQRDIPHHTALCSAIKAGRKKGDRVCLLKYLLHMMEPAFLEMAKRLPAFFCTAFALPIKQTSPQLTSFPPFTPPILSLIPLRGAWVGSCMGLSCLSRLNHNKYISIKPVKSHSFGGSVQSPVTLTVMVLESRWDKLHTSH